MKCVRCGKTVHQMLAGNPSRKMWFDGGSDVWCYGRSVTEPPRHHDPHGVPDLTDVTKVKEWLDA